MFTFNNNMVEDKELKFRKEVVDGAKKIFEKGLNDNNEGNISVRNGRKEEIFITPTANQYDSLTIEQITHLDFNGNVIGKGKIPSTETKLHLAIYKARPKVKCVIHTHSPYATMLSITRKHVPIIMEEQVVFLGGSIDLAPYGEAHTEKVGEVALKALGNKNAALLSNHGVIVCGKSVINAVKYAELVEKLAYLYWGALQIGKPVILENENLDKFYEMHERLFSNLRKK
ncbi:MAG: class II aldolase/adducin family protein [Promethearchaeota archaeon]